MFRVGYESVEEPLKNKRALYEILGIPAGELEERLERDREEQITLYAYLIMHNAGMVHKEKKRLILALDEQRGKTLYYKNLIVRYKELAYRLIRTKK